MPLCRQQAENKLAQLNAQKSELESKLGAPETYNDTAAFKKVEQDYNQIIQDVKICTKDYEKVFEKLMMMEAL